MKPTQKQIDEVIDWAEAGGRSQFPGRSYEEGVRAAIEWMEGNGEAPNEK